MENMRAVRKRDALSDLLIGLVIALMSVPISMGHAQVAGLPPQYGLYGSLLPILAYGLLTTSPRFVFGVEAAPAALAGELLLVMGIAPGSAEAVAVMPAITLMTALWLGLFWLLRAGRFAKFISEPVLGGCVSGIGCTVILIQLPKLFGGTATAGEGAALLVHLAREAESSFHVFSFALGLGTALVVVLCRRRWPKAPMSVVMLGAGVLLTVCFHVDRYGVALFPAVPAGLPVPSGSFLPPLREHFGSVLLSTLTMALVIVSETLVASRSMALEYGGFIDNQRELLAYAAGNLTAAVFGSCPVNGSISRTHRAGVYHVKSQWMSVSASLGMALILLFGTGFIAYLPVPVVTGLVIASLISMLEFDLAAKLWRLDRSEFFIFLGAFLAEFLGLMEGVLVGVLLSFATFTMRATRQPRDFLGCLEGRDGFFPLNRTPRARPIKHTLLYQFNGALFFANIDEFQNDIEGAVREDVRLIVVSGITNVDVTATERLLKLYRRLKQKGVSLYLAGHVSAVNEQLIDFGAEQLIREGAVKPRFMQALAAGGLRPPYPLEHEPEEELIPRENPILEDFTWAYGKYAGPRLERLAQRIPGILSLSGGAGSGADGREDDDMELEKQEAATPMRHICVAGIGAIGGLLSAMLGRKYADRLTLIARGNRAETLRQKGITLHSDFYGEVTAVPHAVALDGAAAGVQDCVFVCVKNYSLDEIAASLRPAVGPETVVVPVMNGVEAGDRLRALLPDAVVCDAVIYTISAFQPEDCSVLQSGPYTHLFIGSKIKERRYAEGAKRLYELLRSVGFDARWTDDVESEIWQKFVLNCAYNTITARHQATSGMIRRNEAWKRDVLDLLTEAYRVGVAEGIALPGNLVEQKYRFMMEKQADSATSSMKRDVEAERPAEIDAFSGAVLRKAEQYGIAVPVTARYHQELTDIIRGYGGLTPNQ